MYYIWATDRDFPSHEKIVMEIKISNKKPKIIFKTMLQFITWGPWHLKEPGIYQRGESDKVLTWLVTLLCCYDSKQVFASLRNCLSCLWDSQQHSHFEHAGMSQWTWPVQTDVNVVTINYCYLHHFLSVNGCRRALSTGTLTVNSLACFCLTLLFHHLCFTWASGANFWRELQSSHTTYSSTRPHAAFLCTFYHSELNPINLSVKGPPTSHKENRLVSAGRLHW